MDHPVDSSLTLCRNVSTVVILALFDSSTRAVNSDTFIMQITHNNLNDLLLCCYVYFYDIVNGVLKMSK